jgi:Holliday junction resolvasome RuvABC endonuclease subunit
LTDPNQSIMALDLGRTTGWAVVKGDGSVLHGSKKIAYEKYQGRGRLFLNFSRLLNSIYKKLGPFDLVAYEKVSKHLTEQAAHDYGGYQAVALRWCEVKKMPYIGVHPATIKAFLVHGRAAKEQMVAKCRQLGYHVKDHNEADAVALALLMEAKNKTMFIDDAIRGTA